MSEIDRIREAWKKRGTIAVVVVGDDVRRYALVDGVLTYMGNG